MTKSYLCSGNWTVVMAHPLTVGWCLFHSCLLLTGSHWNARHCFRLDCAFGMKLSKSANPFVSCPTHQRRDVCEFLVIGILIEIHKDQRCPPGQMHWLKLSRVQDCSLAFDTTFLVLGGEETGQDEVYEKVGRGLTVACREA